MPARSLHKFVNPLICLGNRSYRCAPINILVCIAEAEAIHLFNRKYMGRVKTCVNSIHEEQTARKESEKVKEPKMVRLYTAAIDTVTQLSISNFSNTIHRMKIIRWKKPFHSTALPLFATWKKKYMNRRCLHEQISRKLNPFVLMSLTLTLSHSHSLSLIPCVC